MITKGKVLKSLAKKNITTVEGFYSLYPKSYYEEECYILPKTEKLNLQYYIDNLALNNAIVSDQITFFAVLARNHVPATETREYNDAGIFNKNIFVVINKQVTRYGSICAICKDKLKGVVDECVTTKWGRRDRECILKLMINELQLDLSVWSKIPLSQILEKFYQNKE